MSTKPLRDCRGFVELINEMCSCGGSDRENGCDACKIYHAIGDWLTVEATVPDDVRDLLQHLVDQRENLLNSIAPNLDEMTTVNRAMDWLESRTVAPKEAPAAAERDCRTCAHADRLGCTIAAIGCDENTGWPSWKAKP